MFLDTETSLCDPSSIDGQSEISSLADLAPSDISELEDNPKPKINNELLNLEIIRLNEQKRCLQEEIKTMEDMVQVKTITRVNSLQKKLHTDEFLNSPRKYKPGIWGRLIRVSRKIFERGMVT